MLTEERRQRILHLLDQQTIVKSQELISMLNASESTIRRDLQELENEGLLERVHGGAKKNQLLGLELNMNEKSFKNTQEKKAIAALAINEIDDEDVIYLDAGSTTLEMIPLLKDKSITVVTNSVKHAANLVELSIPTIIIGGTIKLSTDAVIGANSLEQMRQLRFNKAFMGTNGIHLSLGLTTPDPEEAALKRLAIDHAEETFILADHSKFNQVTFTTIASIEAATILTDRCPREYLEDFRKKTTIKEVNS